MNAKILLIKRAKFSFLEIIHEFVLSLEVSEATVEFTRWHLARRRHEEGRIIFQQRLFKTRSPLLTHPRNFTQNFRELLFRMNLFFSSCHYFTKNNSSHKTFWASPNLVRQCQIKAIQYLNSKLKIKSKEYEKQGIMLKT